MTLKQHNVKLNPEHASEIKKRYKNLSSWIRRKMKIEYTKIITEAKKQG